MVLFHIHIYIYWIHFRNQSNCLHFLVCLRHSCNGNGNYFIVKCITTYPPITTTKLNLGLGLFDKILLESSDDVVAKVVIIKHKWKYIVIQMIQQCMMLWKKIINISYHDWTMVWTTLDTLNIRNGIVWSMEYIAFTNKKTHTRLLSTIAFAYNIIFHDFLSKYLRKWLSSIDANKSFLQRFS